MEIIIGVALEALTKVVNEKKIIKAPVKIHVGAFSRASRSG